MRTTMMNKVELHNCDLFDEIHNSITPAELEKVEKKMSIAGKLEDAMIAKGWKNQDLMLALGKKNPSEISKWLSGTHNFTIDTLIDIERVLGITLLNLRNKPLQSVKTYRFQIAEKVEVSRERSGYCVGSSEKTGPGYSLGSLKLNGLSSKLQYV